MVVRSSVVAAAVGVVVGLGLAWVGVDLLEAFLFGTSPRDPLAFVASAALLLTVVTLASYVPARRATRVDPVEALRAE